MAHRCCSSGLWIEDGMTSLRMLDDDHAYGQSLKIEQLETEIKRLRAALEKIANTDYRGNRSTEMTIAYEVLKEKS